MSQQVTAIFQRTGNGFIGYVPDIPGCVAYSLQFSEVEPLLNQAIACHLQSLEQSGIPTPAFTSVAKSLALPTHATRNQPKNQLD